MLCTMAFSRMHPRMCEVIPCAHTSPPAALHDPLADHLPAQRAVVLVIALDDGVDLVLGVGLSDLKRARFPPDRCATSCAGRG